MKITVRESKKNEARFDVDYSMVEEDAKRFDFGRALSDLGKFNQWFMKLFERSGRAIKAPSIRRSAWGSSGYCYELEENSDGTAPIAFAISCSTNPERYQGFEGTIHVGRKRFQVSSANDLTDKLINDIMTAMKKG